MAQLSRNVLITRALANAGAGTMTGAGSSQVDGLASTGINMVNFEGCYFIGHVVQGGTGGAVSFFISSSTAVGATGALLANSSSVIAAGSSATSETFVVDVYRPRMATTSGQTFLLGTLTTASSCATIGPIFAIQYSPRAAAVSTALGAAPNSTASALGITGGVLKLVSPST